jgi:hypothetical protein
MTVMSLVKRDGRRCCRVGVAGARGACGRQWALWLSKRRMGVGRGWGAWRLHCEREKKDNADSNDPKADADAGTAEGVGSQECVGGMGEAGQRNGGQWTTGDW